MIYVNVVSFVMALLMNEFTSIGIPTYIFRSSTCQYWSTLTWANLFRSALFSSFKTLHLWSIFSLPCVPWPKFSEKIRVSYLWWSWLLTGDHDHYHEKPSHHFISHGHWSCVWNERSLRFSFSKGGNILWAQSTTYKHVSSLHLSTL